MAVADWHTRASQEPGNVGVPPALARAYLKTGDGGRAPGAYRRVLTLAPGHAEARHAVAQLAGTP